MKSSRVVTYAEVCNILRIKKEGSYKRPLWNTLHTQLTEILGEEECNGREALSAFHLSDNEIVTLIDLMPSSAREAIGVCPSLKMRYAQKDIDRDTIERAVRTLRKKLNPPHI